MQLKTPILLITFNRPDHVRRVLTEIRKQQPAQLFVCQDGAREGNERDIIKVQEVRDVIKELVDWPCELHTLYQTQNLGCGPGPATGIKWFFENVEQGIVMEDDCLPHPDFFGYCEELLNKYKDDDRVMLINSALYDDQWKCEASYDFTHNMCAGAWASWRRAMMGYDVDLKQIEPKAFYKKAKKAFHCRAEYDWWYFKVLEILQDKEKKSYWDYQMTIHIINSEGMCINPKVNLISNIGFDAEGTHTLRDDGRGNKAVFPILPLTHPMNEVVDKQRDYVCFAKKRSKGWVDDMVSYVYNTMYYSTGWAHRLLMKYKAIKK